MLGFYPILTGEKIRASTGQSPMVRNYVLSFEDAQIFLEKIKDMVEFLLPRFISEGKSYVGIAIAAPVANMERSYGRRSIKMVKIGK